MAQPQCVAALASCPHPTTVKSLRVFIGAYKVLSRVLQHYAQKLGAIEDECGGRQSQEKIAWSDSLVSAFMLAQKHLDQARVSPSRTQMISCGL